MTPDQMRVRAVADLADLLAHTHDDPHDTANRFIGALMRSGWRPVPALNDLPAAPRRASRTAQQAAMAEIRAVFAREGRP